MPELPEVEMVRRQLEPRLRGRAISNARSHPSAKFTPALDAIGSGIESLQRRGKYLIARLDDDHELIIHLGMTGRLAVESEPDLDAVHLRAWWQLDDGKVWTFHDVRRFGRIRVVPAGRYETIATLAALGPEPFADDFTAAGLWRAIGRSRRALKTQLLSQRPVAGIGNIYADEALWLARINPAVRRISAQRAARLVEAIRSALTSGLNYGGTTLRDYVNAEGEPGTNQRYLHCYGQAGRPCKRCGTTLRRRIIDARSTTWCPHCQRR